MITFRCQEWRFFTVTLHLFSSSIAIRAQQTDFYIIFFHSRTRSSHYSGLYTNTRCNPLSTISSSNERSRWIDWLLRTCSTWVGHKPPRDDNSIFIQIIHGCECECVGIVRFQGILRNPAGISIPYSFQLHSFQPTGFLTLLQKDYEHRKKNMTAFLWRVVMFLQCVYVLRNLCLYETYMFICSNVCLWHGSTSSSTANE